MTHLSMESLLGLREPRSEPGNAAALEHLQNCSHCRAAMDRLDQMTAQLKALPILRASRDAWPTVAARVRADRWRRRAFQGAGVIGLAMAASLVMTVVTDRPHGPVSGGAAVAQAESLQKARALSRELEQQLNASERSGQVLDGPTASIVQKAEDRLATVNRAIDSAERVQDQGPDQQVLQLWQEKKSLLDVLVNARGNPASHVEF